MSPRTVSPRRCGRTRTRAGWTCSTRPVPWWPRCTRRPAGSPVTGGRCCWSGTRTTRRTSSPCSGAGSPTCAGPRPTTSVTPARTDRTASGPSWCDLVLVVGSANSSNSIRMVEVARRAGGRAELASDVTHFDPAWLAGVADVP
ncbi:hypothetical protein [Streptomyces niveus]|uniref:hypothetical protein n=1 Tax=Streptomyces niveus TaxID=193462 RepID=UPI0036522FEF